MIYFTKDGQHDNVMNLLMLLSRSKMTNRILALHSQSKRNDAVEKNGTLLCFAGCVGSSITSELLTKHVLLYCYVSMKAPAHVTSVVPFDLLFTLDWSAGEHKEGADEAYHL